MIPIFIPYVNRPDLLDRALDSIPSSYDWNPIIINNSETPLELACTVLDRVPGLNFTQTQNYMLHLATSWNAPFYLFMHSDAEAGKGTVEALIARTMESEYRNWAVLFTAYDALAAFNTSAFRAVGGWDEQFTWYGSDQDMYRRLKLAGYELIDSGLPVHHEPSQTLNSDPVIAQQVAAGFAERVRLYREKWGGEAGRETLLTPYGR